MKKTDRKIIVLLSGGIDSTTCLALAKKAADKVTAVNIFYGQRHEKEIQAAKKVSDYYGVEMIEIDLAKVFERSDCSLLAHSNLGIVHKEYSEQIKETKGMPVSTYVPFRNGLMLSAAVSIALCVGANEVWYGAHADDAAGSAYPDCSAEFVDAINIAAYEGTGGQVKIIAPFVYYNKAEVVRTGLELNVPYELTWSCYEGGERPCGKCGTCIDRAKAFKINGVEDPAL